VGSVLEDLQHWDPKARGVESVTTHGDYFVGREKALTAINEFLNSECPDLRARVVTGGPGSGKSAVLGRLVVNLRRGEQSAVGAAAVHAHRLSLPDIVDSMGQQSS
jgi:hypothetical protein